MGIYGRIVDKSGIGIESDIQVVTGKGFCQEKNIQMVKSGSDGSFEVEYSKTHEQIVLRFYQLKNLIQVIEIEDYKDDINLGEIIVSEQNIAIRGRVVDEHDNPIYGLMVTAYDVDIGPDDFLGCNWTDEDGRYFISYNTSKYHYTVKDNHVKSALNPLSILKNSMSVLDRDPDIVVKVYDKLGVFELKKTEEYSDVKEIVKILPDITIPRSWVEGWHVTLDEVEPMKLTHDNIFEPLVDNEKALKKIINAIEKADQYIYLTQFEFRPDFMAKPDVNGAKGVKLSEKLIEASNRDVKVRLLINQNLLIPDDFDEIAQLFQDTEVEVRPFDARGPHVMHAKILLIDGREAFIIGSPFTQSYWDTVKHFIHDLRRGSRNKQPVHDVSIHIEGGSVPFIEEYFVGLWNYLSNKDFNGMGKLELGPKTSSAGAQSIQVVRSITPRTLTNDGEKGVLEMYRRAIGNAEEYIYMENQYFTNRYIVNALNSALKINKDLELILVINGNPDVPTYRMWQHRRLKKLGLNVDEPIIENPRIGVFNLWGLGTGPEKFSLQPFYVHSKVSIVDDKWATIGTANIDGSSLSGAEEFKQVTDPDLNLNMEINALILDVEEKSASVTKLREELWGEHLGLSPQNKPKGGWLQLWRDVALKNVDSLKKDKPYLNGQILPYTPARSARDKIQSLGIANTNINVFD